MTHMYTNNKTPQHVLSWALAFVFIWFGLSEILTPVNWTSYVPPFFVESWLIPLVVIHGAVLVGAALLLILNIGRRIAAAITAFMLLQIVVTMIIDNNGLSPIAVRDIGLFGAALSLVLYRHSSIEKTAPLTPRSSGIFPEKYQR